MGDPSADQQTLLLRRGVAIGGLILLLVLLFVAVRSCASSRQENALKDYNREVSSIIRDSDTQVGKPFFELLGQAGDESPQDLQTNISGYRVQAEAQLKQARGLDVPGEMKGAQQALLMALEFRRDGLGFIAERIRTALGDEGEAANDAITEIAGADADVPLLRRALPGAHRAADQGRARRGGDRRPADRHVALPAGDRVAERADGGGPARPADQRAATPPTAASPRPACTAPGSRASRSATPRCSPTRPTGSRPAPTPRSSSSSPTRARTTSSTSRSPSPSRAATSRSRPRAPSTPSPAARPPRPP